MKRTPACMLAGLALSVAPLASAQSANMTVPPQTIAGDAFTIQTTGSGAAMLYIVGPGQALRKALQLGDAASFPAGTFYNAGHYAAILVEGTTTETGGFDVEPATKVETLSFLAKPSRLPVGLHSGISGSAYVFDAYNNLITTPMSVSFELSNAAGVSENRIMTTHNGMAWTQMDSATKQGTAKLIARVADVTSIRVIQEVPGDPCGITISAHPDSGKLSVETAPIHDCSGNPVPDGTIVTFTETYEGTQSTVDVPIKQGFARVDLPACAGAKISVASGVVAGNEIRWEGGR